MKTLFLYLSLLVTIGLVVYIKWPKGPTNFSITKTIKSKGLKINIVEYALRSGLYLKVKGEFIGRDSLHEYVFYSQPFGLGPLKDLIPMKKVSIGNNNISKTEDFFYCLSPTDSLFGSAGSFNMEKEDLIILTVADSLINKNNGFSDHYKKSYRNFLLCSKLHFSHTDEGLFFPIE